MDNHRKTKVRVLFQVVKVHFLLPLKFLIRDTTSVYDEHMIMTSRLFGDKDKKSPVGNVDNADNGKNHLYAILWTKTSSATGIRAPSLRLYSESSPWFDIYILVTLYRFDIEQKCVF